MITHPLKRDGFSYKLRPYIRPALRTKARSEPRETRFKEDVLSRIYVAIRPVAAVRAVVHPDAEALGHETAARRAGLRGVAVIDRLDHATGAFSLVAQHREERTPVCVQNILCQHPAREPRDVEVLDGEMRVLPHQAGGELVHEIPALVGHAPGEAGVVGPGLSPARRALLPSGDPALVPALLRRGVPDRLRRGHRRSIGQGDEIRYTQIDADRRNFPLRRLDVRQCCQERDIPMSAVAGNHGMPELGALWNLPVPFDLDCSCQARESDPTVALERQAIAYPELDAVETALGLEAREAGRAAALHPGKEGTEGLVDPAQELLLGGEGVAGKALIDGADGLELQRLVAVAERAAGLAVAVDTLLQRGVVEVTEGTEHRFQRQLLRSSRVEAEAVVALHAATINPLLAHGVSPDNPIPLPPEGSSPIRRG